MTRDTYYEARLEEPSNSMLSHFRRSPLAYWDAVKTGTAETAAMRFGRAFHEALLEPEKFARDFLEIPSMPLRSEADKVRFVEACGLGLGEVDIALKAEELRGAVCKLLENQGRTVLTANDHAILKGQVESLKLPCHADARRLLALGEKERAFHWVDPASGLRCKGKVDSWDLQNRIGFDVKSTEDADVEKFRRSTLAYDYHFQEAMYRRAIEAVDGIQARYVETPDGYESEVLWCFLLVGKERPYHWSWATLEPRLVWEADQEISRNLADLAVCLETNNWPGRWTAEPKRIDRWRTAA